MLTEDLDLPDGLPGEIARCYREARDHWSAWREEARNCFGFYAGDQWDEDTLELLRQQNRPAITFNRITPLVDAVLGHEVNNRAEVRYIPRTLGDSKVSEMLTNASNYFRDQCDAGDEETDAFRDALICGLGWASIKLTDESNPEYDLAIERIDPLEMLPDPRARKPNLADANWVIREKRMSKQDIAALWPEHEITGGDPPWVRGGDGAVGTSSPRSDYKEGSRDGDINDRGYLVIEYQWRKTEVFYVLTDPATGSQTALSADDYNERKDEIEELGAEVEMQRRRTWRRAFMIGNEIVQEDSPCPKHCSYTAITGKRDRKEGVWFGVVRALRDPQRMLNKWLSQMMNIINSNSQGGVMVERDAIANADEFEARWTDPRGVIYTEPDALKDKRIQPKPPATYPAGVDRLYQLGEQAFMQVSGVNAELLGLADRDQPGVLEWQRKQSAVSMLAPLFDALRRFRKMSGRTWLYYMTTYVSDGRMVRIVVDKPQEMAVPTPAGTMPQQLQAGDNYVPFWRDDQVTEYDVIVDQASSAPNVKEQTWSVLIQLFPALKGLIDPQTMLLLLEYSPLPESLISKLKEMAAQKAQQPQQDPKMLEAQASIQADQAKMQAELAMSQQKQVAELEMQKAKLANDIEIKRAELANKLQLAQMEAEAELNLHQQKLIMDHQAKVRSAELQANTDQQVAMFGAEADAQRNNMVAQAEIERGEALKAAESDRTSALAQIMSEWTQRQEVSQQKQAEALMQIMQAQQMDVQARQEQQVESFAQMLAGVMQGQDRMAQAMAQMGDAMSMETVLERAPDGTKRARKVKRKE